MIVVSSLDQNVRFAELHSHEAALPSLGDRDRVSAPDALRNDFQRDRDKILHSKAFRSLSHKTQVFLAVEGDVYRTRLTHTLEVSQIARTIARSLGLNEDLTEAIALGHDLGHTPFGHAGEDALRACIARQLGVSHDDERHEDLYQHNVQGVRVVEVLENEGRGLNLTRQVRDGILHHTGDVRAATMEGRIVAIADRVAYVNHDTDDAIRAGILRESDLPDIARTVLGTNHSARIESLVTDMVHASAKAGDITLSEQVWDAMMELRAFLYKNVYKAEVVAAEDQKARHLVSTLFTYYMEHVDAVPASFRDLSGGDDLRAVTDYVASMTDRFATLTFDKLFVPHAINF